MFASVAITSFYMFLMNTLNNGLVTETKPELRMKVNDVTSHLSVFRTCHQSPNNVAAKLIEQRR
jgi:hypothetical protein